MMKFLVAIVFSCCFLCPCCALHEMVVKATVADLRAFDEKIKAPRGCTLDDLVGQRKKDSMVYRDAPSIFCRDNPGLLTQLLFGERVLVEPWTAGWCKVQALEQKIFYENAWAPCIGFVAADKLTDSLVDFKTCLVVIKPWALLYKKEKKLRSVLKPLSIGTCLSGVKKGARWWIVDTPLGEGVVSASDVYVVDDGDFLDIEAFRASVLDKAKLFLGGPYIWGGCSAWKEHASRQPRAVEKQITGVDCSSLVALAFRANGFLLPRNSHSQKLASIAIENGSELRPGDLIFFADAQQKQPHVNHVVFYCGKNEEGDDIILESYGRARPFGVRVIATKMYPRLKGKDLSSLQNGQSMRWLLNGSEGHEIVYFGTFFTSEKLAEIRRNFLNVKRGPLVSQ